VQLALPKAEGVGKEIGLGNPLRSALGVAFGAWGAAVNPVRGEALRSRSAPPW